MFPRFQRATSDCLLLLLLLLLIWPRIKAPNDDYFTREHVLGIRQHVSLSIIRSTWNPTLCHLQGPKVHVLASQAMRRTFSSHLNDWHSTHSPTATHHRHLTRWPPPKTTTKQFTRGRWPNERRETTSNRILEFIYKTWHTRRMQMFRHNYYDSVHQQWMEWSTWAERETESYRQLVTRRQTYSFSYKGHLPLGYDMKYSVLHGNLFQETESSHSYGTTERQASRQVADGEGSRKHALTLESLVKCRRTRGMCYIFEWMDREMCL